MEFRILGPVEVRRDGTRIPLAGTKIHTVLAALLLSRGRVVPDERISGFLWGWEPPTTLNAQIYTYVSRLRKQLGDEAAIARRQPGYVLEAGPDTSIDAVEFDRLDRLGRDALEGRHYAKASTLLTSALELWRGTPLANTTEHLAQAERPHWEEARSAALVARIQADMALGRHVHLVTELTRLVAEQPLSEQLRALLMTALYQGSRQADALAVYRTGCQILREELGIDPGPVLRRTHWQVLGGGEPEAPEAALSALLPPGAVTLGRASAPQESGRARAGASEAGGGRGGRRTVPAMLPEDDTPFTGRAQHLAEIVYELRSASAHSARNHRVVVTGTPGVGRSRARPAGRTAAAAPLPRRAALRIPRRTRHRLARTRRRPRRVPAGRSGCPPPRFPPRSPNAPAATGPCWPGGASWSSSTTRTTRRRCAPCCPRRRTAVPF